MALGHCVDLCSHVRSHPPCGIGWCSGGGGGWLHRGKYRLDAASALNPATFAPACFGPSVGLGSSQTVPVVWARLGCVSPIARSQPAQCSAVPPPAPTTGHWEVTHIGA